LKIIKEHNGLRILISETLLNEIAQIGIKHYPNEFGGFLIGKYSKDYKTLQIEDFILPIKYEGHRYLFERSTDGLMEIWEKLFKEKNQYYIGEWHTHPDSSTHYSGTDLEAMGTIARHEQVNILNPILLILSVSKKSLNEYSFYIYKNQKLLAYE